MCIITVGHDVRKRVFALSNKLRFKPVCLATETILNVEILRVANGVIIQSVFVKHSTTEPLGSYTVNRKNNKGAGQTVGMHRLAWALVVCMQLSQFSLCRSPYKSKPKTGPYVLNIQPT